MDYYCKFEVREGVGVLTIGDVEITLPKLTIEQAAALLGMVADANIGGKHIERIIALDDYEWLNVEDELKRIVSER